MKQLFTLLFVLVFALSAKAQSVIESFDVSLEASGYNIVNFKSNDSSGITRSLETSNVYEGQGALRLEYAIKSLEAWGSSLTLAMELPSDRSYWDFSGYDSIRFNFYNEVQSSQQGRAFLQFVLYDKSEFALSSNQKEFWWSYIWPFDLEPGWNTITLPLEDVGSLAESDPGSGFWQRSETGQPGNETLDLDKISGVGFSIAVEPPADGTDITGTFLVDNLQLVGENTATAINTLEALPNAFSLEQNYPNPFNPATKINFNIDRHNHVKLNIYDVLGREVATLVNENMMPGAYSVDFNAANLSSGTYFIQLRAGALVQTKKMTLIP